MKKAVDSIDAWIKSKNGLKTRKKIAIKGKIIIIKKMETIIVPVVFGNTRTKDERTKKTVPQQNKTMANVKVVKNGSNERANKYFGKNSLKTNMIIFLAGSLVARRKEYTYFQYHNEFSPAPLWRNSPLLYTIDTTARRMDEYNETSTMKSVLNGKYLTYPENPRVNNTNIELFKKIWICS